MDGGEMNKSKLEKALTLSHVPRWAIVEVAKPQTVAEHSYRTAVFAVELAERICKANALIVLDMAWVMIRSLFHDAEEAESGDIPTPFKQALSQKYNVEWDNDRNAKGDGIEGAIVHMADKIEAVTYLTRYGQRNNGRVVTFLKDEILHAKRLLFEVATKNYMSNMPGLNEEAIKAKISGDINRIVDDLIDIGTTYE